MFSVETQGAVNVVQLVGPLNHENADTLTETIADGLTKGQPMVVLDMSDVPLLDSAGLDSLLDVRDSVHQQGGDLKLAALSQLCEDVLRVTGVNEHFDSHKEVKSAVRSFIQ